MDDKYKFKFDEEKKEYHLNLYGYNLLIYKKENTSYTWEGTIKKNGELIFEYYFDNINNVQYVLRNKLFEIVRANRNK